jgi:hypothetical protein
MDTLLGSFAPVEAAEMEAAFAQCVVPTLDADLRTMRSELEEYEAWLGSPPAGATAAEVEAKLVLWDGCRQWLLACEQDLAAKRSEIAALDDELAEVRGLMRGLEQEQFQSHSDMAGADACWDDLDRRENRIFRRLEELGAPPPLADGDSGPRQPQKEETPSHIQRALDAEWACANFAGPGCPFCDSIMGGCRCWEERREAQEAEERRRSRQDRAAIAARIARGECTCDQLSQHSDYPNECEVCQREEELRCRECGQLQCRPDCCGGCGGCSRCRGDPCKRCGDWDCCCYDDRDERSSCGCGACEEHDYREVYDNDY